MTLRNIIICEGKNDRIFIDETLRTEIGIEPTKFKTFEEPRFLEKAVQYGETAPILISEGNGFPGNTRVVVRLCCKLMRYVKPISAVVIGDADRGSVYHETADHLIQYLGTHCRIHAINPIITRTDSDKKVTVLGGRIDVTIWAFEVPENLENQISHALKSKYQHLEQYRDGDETIEGAVETLDIDEEAVIRKSVSFLKNEVWFRSLCDRINFFNPC